MGLQYLVTVYITVQTYHVDDASDAPTVLLLGHSNCVCLCFSGWWRVKCVPLQYVLSYEFSEFFIKLFSFHPFHLFVVYAHMTS